MAAPELTLRAALALVIGRARGSFSYGEMVAYASRGTEVRPGDVLGSGTCGGGSLVELWGRQGPGAHAPLRPGDAVTVTVEPGALVTPLVPPVLGRLVPNK